MRRAATMMATTVLVLTAFAACGDDDEGADTTSGATPPVATDAPATDAPATDAPATDAPATTGGGATTQPTGTDPTDTEGGGDEQTLTISGFAFPENLTVAAGSPISVVNEDDADHTVTAEDGTFDMDIAGGETAELVIDEPGTYKYVCNIHPQMEGTIVVE